MVEGLFGRTMAIMEKTLTMRALRHNLLASNVTNLDTPGYRAVDLDFAQELGRAREVQGRVSLAVAHPRHIPHGAGEIEGRRVVSSSDSLQGVANDGNSVDLEREMAKLAENHLMYNATAQLLGRSFSKLRYAIDEGGK